MYLETGAMIREYQIVRNIAEGGMGTIYQAHDTHLDRPVAIKMLKPELSRDVEFVSRFFREAKLQAKLHHPNIVELYTLFTEGPAVFMIMEYVEGQPLKNLIIRNGALPEPRAKKIFRQILAAIGVAHQYGIIHRDIKPGNILITADDEVKVMDFGIAKVVGDLGLTNTGTRLGSIPYMSPEQVRGETDIDARTDIYSLGLTYFEMLNGTLPFNTQIESEFNIQQKIVNGLMLAPRSTNQAITPQSVAVIQNCTRVNKFARPSDTAAIITFLYESAKTPPSRINVPIEPPTEVEQVVDPVRTQIPPAPPQRSYAALVWFLVAVVVVIILIVVFNSSSGNSETGQNDSPNGAVNLETTVSTNGTANQQSGNQQQATPPTIARTNTPSNSYFLRSGAVVYKNTNYSETAEGFSAGMRISVLSKTVSRDRTWWLITNADGDMGYVQDFNLIPE